MNKLHVVPYDMTKRNIRLKDTSWKEDVKIKIDQFKPDLNNMASLQRGVGTFMKYCYSCHSLKYSRWGRVANDLQIPEDIFFEYLVPDKDAGPYDLMVAPIHELEIDNAPPDLTLVARKRTSSWVYTLSLIHI